jgi:extracellular elastinolytic metalloproteinase
MATEVDVRQEAAAATSVPPDRRELLHAAAEAASARLPDGHDVQIASFDPATGNPAVIVSRDAPVDGGDYVGRALAHVQDVGPALGLAPEQPPEFQADPFYQRTSADGVAVHLRQQYKGIAVYGGGETVRFDPSGRLLEVAGRSYTIGADLAVEPRIPPVRALQTAVEHLAEPGGDPGTDPFGQPLTEPDVDRMAFAPRTVTAAADRPDRATVFEDALLARPVTVSLLWFPLADALRLAWHLSAAVPGGPEYRFVIDAADSRILLCRRLTHALGGHAQVVLRSGEPRREVDFPMPADGYGLPVPAGFPRTWLRDDTTDGPTVRAVDATTGSTVRGTSAGGVVTFAAPPDIGAPEQLVLNVFAYCAIMHDALYLLGFREADGNFQQDSFGLGGLGGDPVQARVHPAPVWGTANMGTLADGTPPEMNMGLVASTGRHTALDADVVYHEYTHGLTERLVGGPLDSMSMDGPQAGGLNEGISDFVACSLLGKTVVGDWVVDRPGGIRRHAYDESYPGTYADVGTPQYTKVHDIGELWCAVMMSVARRLGRWETLQIMVDAEKLTAADPTILAVRDAVLLAARQFATARGDDPAAVEQFAGAAWQVFARYGMGPGARTDSVGLTGIVADFEPPPAAGTTVVSAEATPGLAIPDADPHGILSTLTLPDAGTVESLTATVAISHPYRGDLVVTLVAPDGREVVLHDRAGGGGNDVRRSFDPAAVAGLAALAGMPAGGVWSLRVADHAMADTGRLESWSLAARVRPDRPTIARGASPGAQIKPDAPVESRIAVEAPAPVAELALDVDISHAYAGDLSVALRGPTGKRVTVHRRGGAERDHLIRSYGSADGEPLAAFVGLEAAGEWTLSIVDNQGRDAGKLNAWRLTVAL